MTAQQLAFLLIVLDAVSLLAYLLKRSQDRELARSTSESVAEDELAQYFDERGELHGDHCTICMGPCEADDSSYCEPCDGPCLFADETVDV